MFRIENMPMDSGRLLIWMSMAKAISDRGMVILRVSLGVLMCVFIFI